MTRSAQQTQRLLKLLVRLGAEYTQQARSLFFNSQNLEIKGALQHQRFEGDIGAYVGKISKALFSALRRAVEKYQELFAPEVDPEVAAPEDQSTAFSMTSSLRPVASGRLATLRSSSACLFCRAWPKGMDSMRKASSTSWQDRWEDA